VIEEDAEADAHPHATAAAYDSVAVRYARFVGDGLAGLPVDRAVLALFASLVGESGQREVADLGCGPGHLTAHLRGLGLQPFGVDLSSKMIELARASHSGLRFEVGSMATLEVPDHALGGVLSWYSLIHTPPQHLPHYLAEFHRVLTPGGHLLLAFFESDDDSVTTFDHRVAPAYRWPLQHLEALARTAGFRELVRISREPNDGERHRRGHLLMHRSNGG
jgi:ubiquinone/menaquinone biosynthesis C-methylase UbiE